MVKILYDTRPYNLKKQYRKCFAKSSYICLAVCGPETIIQNVCINLLRDYFKTRTVLIWICAEELLIKNLENNLHTECYSIPMKPTGFLTYSLAQLCFELSEEDVMYFFQQFSQLYSMEIHIVDHPQKDVVVSYLSQHPKIIDMTHFSNRTLVLSKSGDEDELELVFSKDNTTKILKHLCNALVESYEPLSQKQN